MSATQRITQRQKDRTLLVQAGFGFMPEIIRPPVRRLRGANAEQNDMSEGPPNSKAAGCESAAQNADNDNQNYTQSNEESRSTTVRVTKPELKQAIVAVVRAP
jgi:hypothetical protein